MKRLNYLLLIILSIISINCFAEPSKLKIGVINSKDLENSLYMQDINKRLDKEFSPKNEAFNVKQKEFQSKGQLFERDRAILSEKERLTKERDLTKMQQDLQHMAESLEIEFKSKAQEEYIAFHKAINHAVNKMAKAENYDLILTDQEVKFSKPELDCTAQIIKEIDAKFKSNNK